MSVISQVFVVEDFNAGTSFPDGWTSPTLPSFNITSTNACYGNSARGPLNQSSANPELVFMSQEASGNDINISFEYKILTESTSSSAVGDFGSFELQYSIDDGKNWTTYYTINNSNHTPSVDCVKINHTLPASDVPVGAEFGWRIKGNYNSGDNFIYIDNFEAIEDVDCKQPYNIVVERVNFDNIVISWEEISGSSTTEWEVAYCPKDISPDNPICFLNNIQVATSNPYTITGLSDATEYDIYVRSVCSSSSKSVWSGPIRQQTLAIGADCENAFEITSLPYNHSSNTQIYGNNYNGMPGSHCNTVGNFLDGYDVVYKYNSTKDDILQIDLTGNLHDSVGIFIYESCADIGTECFAGATTINGEDIGIEDLYIKAGESYYILISSLQPGSTTDYTLNITNFDCNNWESPEGERSYEFFNQTLADFSQTRVGVQPTIEGVDLIWYEDAALTKRINDLNTPLQDGDEFWVVQEIMGCTSPSLHVVFSEFDCNDLSVKETIALTEACDEGTVTINAKAATDHLIWYDQPTGGNPVGVGPNFITPVIDQNTSYWVSEFFRGESELKHQANPGPVTSDKYSTASGVEFELFETIVIKDVEVYIVGPAGELTVNLMDSKGGVQERTFYVPGGTVDNPTLVTLDLDFEIKDLNSGPFRLVKRVGPEMLGTPPSKVLFPYAIGSSGRVINGVTGTTKRDEYFYFYNWTVLSMVPLCESDRIEVEAVVLEILDVEIQTSANSICSGSTVELTAVSDDDDYEYTWEWTDENGRVQRAQGESISRVLKQNTSFVVTAQNKNTKCSTSDTVTIEVVGAEEVAVTPTIKTVCLDDVVMMNAGEIQHSFNEDIEDWTFVNRSRPAPNFDAASAGWKQVSSPYNIADNATSNDGSSFMISNADALGPNSNIETEMISPIINLVGLTSATLEFYHYYKHLTTKATTAEVMISTNSGRSWQNLMTYRDNRGEPHDFEKVTIDLTEYIDVANVQIKFRYTGLWGWWWAIDNVKIKQTYADGRLTWSGEYEENLFIDEKATIPYQGQHTNKVYFKSDKAGKYEFNIGLNVESCSDLQTNTVTIEVKNAEKPVGDEHQEFHAGSRVSDIEVEGSDLTYYLVKENEYIRQSINSELIAGETYYISQKIGSCESDYLEVLVSFICPNPINISVNVDYVEEEETASAIVFWDFPEVTTAVEGYKLILRELENDEIIEEKEISNRLNYVIIDNLSLEKEFVVEVFSVCSRIDEVYSDVLEIAFNTKMLTIPEHTIDDFKIYPNPVNEIMSVTSGYNIERIELYSKDGKRVLKKENINKSETQINMEAFSTGTYLLVITADSQTKVLQIVKK